MISSNASNQQKVQMIDRDHILRLLNNGLEVKSYRFTRQAALAWLTSYPGDLEINLFYVKTLIAENRLQQAAQVLEKIIKNDPLFVDALKVGVKLFATENPQLAKKVNGVLQALEEQPSAEVELPDWGTKLVLVKQSVNGRQFEAALALLLSIIGDSTHPELADLLHLEIAFSTSDAPTVLNLARLYHSRWPECLQISLVLARAWMETGNDDEAVKMLHQCAALDATGQVPTRLWGKEFPYKPLYPNKLEIVSSFSVPAEVAGKLGMNQLAAGVVNAEVADFKQAPVRTEVSTFDGYRVLSGEDGSFQEHPKVKEREEVQATTREQVKKPNFDQVKDRTPFQTPSPKPDTVREVEEELRKVAASINQPVLSNTDNRFPSYVILTMKQGLQNQFGTQSAEVLFDEIEKLAQVIQEKKAWSSIVFMPDDLEVCGRYGITPIDAIDPWKIKLALVDLDKSLHKTGERIGCVLIVGGEEVIPFHRLPNPTDDSDTEVKSDNPYGSLDTNYFVPDWPVGRLPGEDGSDVGLLLNQIRNTVQYHTEDAALQTWSNRIANIFQVWNHPWLKHFGNVGYSASVWKRSSLAAFHPIGEGKNLFLSPNGSMSPFSTKKFANAPFGYFNLHGVEDGSEWYGQKDPNDQSTGADYPVALKPSDLLHNYTSPRIVYSEACYGGHIFGKKENESIALTMSGIGVLAMIGSSTISYGSVNTPLIGADLMGYLLMKHLTEGMPVGNAFIKSKIEFVREMNRRQGYLDGEDQKTLISFILYGDPLVTYDPYQGASKTIGREASLPIVKTICDRTSFEEKSATVGPKMISTAKELVKDYLPGIDYAEVRIQNQQARMVVGGKNLSQPKRVVVSFSKQIAQADKVHKQFAKVTLDQRGQVVKLALSR